MPFEAAGPRRLALYPHHGRHARVGRVAPVPRREVVEDQRLGLDLLGEGGGHDGGAVAVLDGLGLDIGVRLALQITSLPWRGVVGKCPASAAWESEIINVSTTYIRAGERTVMNSVYNGHESPPGKTLPRAQRACLTLGFGFHTGVLISRRVLYGCLERRQLRCSATPSQLILSHTTADVELNNHTSAD